MGKLWEQSQSFFSWSPKSVQMVTAAMKLRYLLLGRQSMTNLTYSKAETLLCWQRSHNQSYDFSSSHVWMRELDHKEGWVLKNWCFETVVLEKTLQSPLDCKEIKPVNPKGNLGRCDAETETPILWPPAVKNWLIRKDPGAGKAWNQRRRGGQRLR